MYYKFIRENVYFDMFSKKFVEENKINPILRNVKFNDVIKLLDYRNKNRLILIFTITTKCNLSCKYCFQNSCNRDNMTDVVEDDTFEKIERYILINNIKFVDLTIFGGEPFLNVDGMKKTFVFFEKLNDKYGVRTNFLITTNGLNTNFEYVYAHIQNNYVEVQITFDGTEKVNNIRRLTKDRNINLYKTILNNLEIYLKSFDRVFIKFNFDKENVNCFKDFLNDIKLYCGKYIDKVVVVLESIQNTFCNNYNNYLDNTSLFLADSYIDFISILIDAGISYTSKIFSTPCMHISKNSFMVDTTGEFYSCLSAYNIDDFKIDLNFKDNYTDNNIKRDKFRKISTLERNCKSCEYLPCCCGGCAYELYSNKKNIFDTVNCRKIYFDYIIEKFYKEIYLKKGIDRIE